jgi:hypothetical protein
MQETPRKHTKPAYTKYSVQGDARLDKKVENDIIKMGSVSGRQTVAQTGMDGGEQLKKHLSLDNGDTEEEDLRRQMFVFLILCFCKPEILCW